MTLEQIESETKTVIVDMKEAIAEEDKIPTKTSNYRVYKERLKMALELQANIAEAKKTNEPLDIFEFDLWELKQPIY